MKKFKIGNYYAGIGGNRKLWDESLQSKFGNNYEITAIENNPEIAAIYKLNFPKDKIVIGDAHEYLLNHYKKFDFIWGSPPCPKHTRMNVNFNRVGYIDLRLWQEIIFLETWFKGKYCIENVIPYYKPLIEAQQVNRHLFWCNFKIDTTSKKNPPKQINNIISQFTKRQRKYYQGDIAEIKTSIPRFGFDLSKIKLKTRKDQILRNLVDPKIGKMILNKALNIITEENIPQGNLNFK